MLILEDVYKSGPAYILPNGQFLNLKTNNIRNHIDYELNYSGTWIDMSKGRQITNLKNYIRINDRTPFEVVAELPIKEISDSQYNSLKSFLDSLLDRGITFVEVCIEPTGSLMKGWTRDAIFYNKFDLIETKVEYVLQKIKNFYNK